MFVSLRAWRGALLLPCLPLLHVACYVLLKGVACCSRATLVARCMQREIVPARGAARPASARRCAVFGSSCSEQARSRSRRSTGG
jgi:hypothetical protein